MSNVVNGKFNKVKLNSENLNLLSVFHTPKSKIVSLLCEFNVCITLVTKATFSAELGIYCLIGLRQNCLERVLLHAFLTCSVVYLRFTAVQ